MVDATSKSFQLRIGSRKLEKYDVYFALKTWETQVMCTKRNTGNYPEFTGDALVVPGTKCTPLY